MDILPKQRARKFLSKLFQNIKHGDQEHQNWLENKIDELESDLETEILEAIIDYKNT